MHRKQYSKLIVLLVLAFFIFVSQVAGQISQELINNAIHATVQINIFQKDAKGEYQYIGNGSGSVIASWGLILTNYHVAFDINNRRKWDLLVIGYTRFTDEAPQAVCYGEVVYSNPNLDLALLRCYDKDGKWVPDNYFPHSHKLGNSDKLQLGQNIYIIGYPGVGEGLITFTSGRVSAFTQNKQWISTDATVTGGNSGGAALDDSGTLIGIPTEIGGSFARVGADGQMVTAYLTHIRPINTAKGLIYTYLEGLEEQSSQAQTTQQTQTQQTQQQQSTGKAVYMGRMVSAETGRGISGATIAVFKPGVKMNQITEENIQNLIFTTAQTDANGYFQLEHALTVGKSYGVVIVANGYEPIAMDDGIVVKEAGRWDFGEIKMARQKR